MKDVKLTELKKLFPNPEEELIKIQEMFNEINEALASSTTAEEYLEKCPFCDFSKVIHRILIDNMTYAKVEYQIEWDDLGDWSKVFQSPIFPKDENGNLVLSKPELIIYENCTKSIIANFTEQKMIISDLSNRIFVAGPRGTINIPYEMDSKVFREKVVSLNM